ncbi:unnamed protein product, partial [Symbiodinium pilosum]
GFCLFGYVAALSCLLTHMKGRIAGENERALTARMQNALGPERSLELLLESSPWNLSSAKLGLEPPKAVLAPVDLEPWAWQPLPQASKMQVAKAWALLSQALVASVFTSFVILHANSWSPEVISQQEPPVFRLAVVGHHAGMSLESGAEEPAMVIAGVLAELAEEEKPLRRDGLQIEFFGQYYSCELLGRCDQDSLQELFRQWMFDESVRKDTTFATETWNSPDMSVAASKKVFKSEAHTANSMWTIFTLRTSGHSELHGGDWAGAVGVAGAAASGGRGHRLGLHRNLASLLDASAALAAATWPVFHYMVNWLVGEHTPTESRVCLPAQFEEWHVALIAEAARLGGVAWLRPESIQSSKHHFCTTAWARLSIDISYLVGLKVPHAATVGWHTALHAGPGLRWAWRPGHPARAAVPRNVLTRRIQGQLFNAMFGHFNRLPWVKDAAVPVEVDVWQGGLESINRGAGDPWQGQVRGKIWWSDAVKYMAAIYLAGDITLLTFSELYSLQVAA